jgi:hypothetical protein
MWGRDDSKKKSRRTGATGPSARSTLYLLHPPDSKVVMRFPSALTFTDRLVVAASSLFIVGSVVWVPLVCRWAWYKIRSERDQKRRRKYAALAVLCTMLAVAGPHRSPRFGTIVGFRKWKMWESWLKFIAMEVIVDQPHARSSSFLSTPSPSSVPSTGQPPDKAMVAYVPHGIFPFALAFGVLPEAAQCVFGLVRPVVATATEFFPVVRDILRMCECV